MGEPTDDFEPLFDYSRVQPLNFVCLDDDGSDSSPASSPKRRKILAEPAVEKENENGKVTQIVEIKDKEEEDWLLPPSPPKWFHDTKKFSEDSTIQELRLKKQELASFVQSAADVVRVVEESVRRDLNTSLQSALENGAELPPKPQRERAKVVISIQDKDELKQFRVYMDDNFEKLFKMYADKVKLDLKSLVFCFDGDKISPTETPASLGMEDDDIIEVHVKSG